MSAVLDRSSTVGRNAPNYLTHERTIASWFLSTDHKRIALLYAGSVTFFFFVGGIAATMIRLHLLSPTGAIFANDTYNRIFTTHGVVMVWFFLVPAAPTVLGNFILPLMIGARDLAFPRLNLASWYMFMLGGAFVLWALFWGGLATGWTFYTPLSTGFAQGNVVLAEVGVILAGYSSIATGLNFIVTIHRLRAPGMTWFRMPVFCWSLYSTSVIIVLATPVLTMALLLIGAERLLHVGVFDPNLGGDPVLFQHLFWFYSHPAVYIMILPGFGIVTEIITAFSRKRVFGYQFVIWASVSIAIIGFFVWVHHMFVAGVSLYSGVVFSLLSYIIAVPSAIKVFNWLGTMHNGFIKFDAPMLYAVGFVGLFTTGGLAGLWVAALAADVFLHDTYFVVAHFHFIMVGGMVTAFFGGLHFWWPKITGRMYSEALGRIAAGLMFLGFNMTFLPQFVLGFLGMPRRYATYPDRFAFLNIMSSGGAGILAVAYVMPLFYLAYSLWRGERAGDNPWGAAGLEWSTSSPPPKENFHETPSVTWEAYNYPEPERQQYLLSEARAKRMREDETHV